MSISVLLVEDDPILGRSLHQALGLELYDVIWAQRFQDALLAFEEKAFQCCVFDIGLPDGSGIELCRQIRQSNSQVPILFLTAQTDESTLLKAFDAGANDFLKKPFNQKELFARLKALTRHLQIDAENINFGQYRLNTSKRILSFADKNIEFNKTEIQILYYFFSNAEKVVTREKLIQFLGKENEIFDRTIDSHVSHVRKILKDNHITSFAIKSIYGIGYKFEIE